MPKMSRNEIQAFENACQTERREEGMYVRLPELSQEWAGPYLDRIQAIRSYRLVWCVE